MLCHSVGKYLSEFCIASIFSESLSTCGLIGAWGTESSNGFGEGRQYVTNPPNKILDPLKKPEFSLPNNACAYPFDNFNYYPTMKDYNVNKRQAVPGGGDMLSGGDPAIFN